MPTREEALNLLKKYNKSEALINHGLQVEACMRHFAKKYGEDEEKWAIAGLLHDLDYELYPNEHCYKAKEILEQNGYDQEIIRAVMSHGFGICTDVEPKTLMEKTLYAVDELSGLVNACVLVRPNKSIEGLNVKSVKKKFKSKSFAAGVNREVIKEGAKMLNMELDTLIAEVIEAMRSNAKELGL